MTKFVLLALGFALSGCDGGESPGSSGAAADAGVDAEAGTGVDGGCAPGEATVAGGECQPAGVPAGACGEGFVSDTKGGCTAVLPDVPCDPGTMALPGETRCREVMDCGAGPWALDLPDEATTQYVDASFVGTSDGTSSKPWVTLQQGIDAAEDGAIVAVASGSYAADVQISGHAVRLWGRCPTLVSVLGGNAGVIVGVGADGSAIRGLSLAEGIEGIYVSGASDVSIDRIWTHDTTGLGVDIRGMEGPTSATLTGLLVESATVVGVLADGVEISLQDSVIRGTRPDDAGNFGAGMGVQQSFGAATGSVTHSTIEDNHAVGLLVSGCKVSIASTLVRDTKSQVSDGTFGEGIQVTGKVGAAAEATIVGSVVERSTEIAINVAGATATIEATTVRETAPRGASSTLGLGLHLIAGDAGGSHATLATSLIEDSKTYGVMVSGSELAMTSSIVRGTSPSPGDPLRGSGIYVQKEGGARGSLTLKWSIVEDSEFGGIGVSGCDADIEGSVIRDTKPRPMDQHFGRSLQVQFSPDLDPGHAALRTTVLSGSFDTGIFIIGSDVTVEGCIVRGVQARPLDDTYGDGILVASVPDGLQGELLLTGSRIEDTARAGVASFSATARVGETVLECNVFPLDGESFLGGPFDFQDLGGNACGCGGVSKPCTVLSSGLTPPEEL